MRRLALLVAVATASIAVTACGSSGTPKSTEAFCSTLARLRDQPPLGDAASSDQVANQALETFDELLKTAPQQLRGDLRRFRNLVQQVRDLDESDPTKLETEIRSLAADPQLLSSGQALASFAQKECGIEGVFGGLGGT